MNEQPRDNLKSYFQTGDRPTETQFQELIDSMLNKQDDGITIDYANDNNIGIGIPPDPDAKLNVNGKIKATDIQIDNADAQSGKILMATDTDGNATWQNISPGGFMPAGAVIMWYGAIVDIPTGWALCDGQNGTPDLRSRFVVGASDLPDLPNNPLPAGLTAYDVDTDGGDENVILGVSQLPSHAHGMDSAGSHSHSGSINNNGNHLHEYRNGYLIRGDFSSNYVSGCYKTSVENVRGDSGSDADNEWISYENRNTLSNGLHNHTITIISNGSHNHTIQNEGGSQPHENRPPYYALAYIMKT